MSNLELLKRTITEVAPEVQRRSVSPVELVDAALAQIEAQQPKINGFITVLADRARQRAKELEQELVRGEYRGPLHGIPIGVKDNIMTAGVRTTAGSKILADWVPDEGAPVVEWLEQAGAIVIGKENLCEFASGPTGYNPHYGDIRNPWDPSRIAGGSSGGSGANVASFQTFASLGTDSGGSVRIPAAFCGVVGIKPTHGRVSLRGGLPPYLPTDQIGPLARSVRDTALVLQAMAQYDPLDPTSVPVPAPDYAAELERGVDGLVVGIPTNHFFDVLDPHVEEAVKKAIGVLEGLGIQVREVTVDGLEHRGVMGLTGVEALVYHEPWIRTRRHDYSEEVLYRQLPGGFLRAVDYLKTLKYRQLLKQSFARVFQEVDALVSATIPIPAFPIGADSVTVRGEEIPVKGPGIPSKLVGRNTQPANWTGLPGLSVPCGFHPDGLPIGLQLIGRPFQEDVILRIGHAYEVAVNRQHGVPPTVSDA